MRRGAQIPGQIDGDRDVPERQHDDEREDKPAAVPMTASIKFSISTCSRICRQDQPMACRIAISRRRSVTADAVARQTKAAANSADDRGDDQSHALREKQHADSACRIESSLDTTPFLPSSAMILSTTLSIAPGWP